GDQEAMVGFDADRDGIFRGVADLGQQLQQLRETGGVVGNTAFGHDRSDRVDDRDIVGAFAPVDAAEQVRQFTTPSLSREKRPGGVTQRPNRGTRGSVISLAVRDSSALQEPRAVEELTAREHIGRSPPAAGSSNAHPTTTISQSTGSAPFFLKTSHVGRKPGITADGPTTTNRSRAVLSQDVERLDKHGRQHTAGRPHQPNYTIRNQSCDSKGSPTKPASSATATSRGSISTRPRSAASSRSSAT